MWFTLRLRAISETLTSAKANYPLAARLLRKQDPVHFFRLKSARKYRLVSDRIVCDRITAGLWFIALCLFLVSPSESLARPSAASASQPVSSASQPSAPATPFSWDANAEGQFITSLCKDTKGNVWVGTEDQGVYQLDPAAPKAAQHIHFTTKDGLGDNNAYALACDKAGRLWVGTLNHGVSVYNGKAWRTYGPLDGPLGSRVFALAVSPKDGSVWGATEAGLFRYQNSKWTYFTRTEGLPSDQANALAFDSDGTLYVGTQCDGIAISSPADNYKSWRVIPGPRQMPQSATGDGLPSALINCLLVSASGTVYAGTPLGLAGSKDEGLTWHFRRGVDWKAKLAGLYHPTVPDERPISGNLLHDDYVTCLGEDGAGRLFIGHRQGGVEVFDPKLGKRVQSGANGGRLEDYIGALLVDSKAVWVGMYGGGLLPPAFPEAKTASSIATLSIPALPIPAARPTLAQLNSMLRVVTAVVPDKEEMKPKVVALQDDWQTGGNWLGRYGRYWACLNAMCSPQDYLWGAGWEPVNYSSRIGANAASGDSLRYWVQWLYTQDSRVLELPPTYLDSRIKKGLTTADKNRREAEIDDHGETYPQTLDGPHLYQTLTVPEGLFFLSLYNFNKDGHDGDNRFRDYRISVRTHSGTSLTDISNFDSQPELASGRIHDFWGGVWKRFLVRGPITLTVQVSRNYSFNTILPAVMLDLADETPPPYFKTVAQQEKEQASSEGPAKKLELRRPSFRAASSEAEAANRVFNLMAQVQKTNSVWYAANSCKLYVELLRWYAAQSLPTFTGVSGPLLQRLATCYYQVGMYSQWETCQKKIGLTPARDIEKALRWDGISDSGQGFQVVTDHLALDDHKKLESRNLKYKQEAGKGLYADGF